MKLNVCSACDGALPARSAYCPHCGRAAAGSSVCSKLVPEALQVMEETQEITLNQLAAADYVLIQTHNNLYKFTLVEPSSGYGILSGGALGNRQFHSRLLGAVCCKNAKSVAHPFKLKVGLNALFDLDAVENQESSGATQKQVATSSIIRLTHVGGGKITRLRTALADGRAKPEALELLPN